jgi:pyruvate dehydrogenase E2 component (dihydrolipoamide acetyltransferase)
MAEVRMPKMGDGMEEGTILRWLKNEGDLIALEEPIAEVETDKANVEIPAEDAGVLSRIVIKAGETVPVGELIAMIGAVPEDKGAEVSFAAPLIEPVVDRIATGEAGTAAEDAEADAPGAPVFPEVAMRGENERIKTSPLARKMAEKLGINLSMVPGSGPGGRIVERDINAFAMRVSSSSTSPQASISPIKTPSAGNSSANRPALPPPVAPGEETEISRMRKAIARRTLASKQGIPHFYLTMPIEMDSANQMIAEINSQSSDTRITINDLVIKAAAMTLEKMPDVNVSFTPDEKIRHYDSINIGVAVGSNEGLTIPVIQDCGNKTLRQISMEAKSLVAKARTGALSPQEMSGGTFSITNLGMFGIEEFAAIINPPEAAILAVGAMVQEVMVTESGEFKAVRRMRVTLSCDHRCVDGLLGAQFLKALKDILEKPYNLIA